MEKIQFKSGESGETAEFYVLEQTRISGSSYILVTDREEGDAECLILREMSDGEEEESVYELVEDEEELSVISGIFEELLEDVDIER